VARWSGVASPPAPNVLARVAVVVLQLAVLVASAGPDNPATAATITNGGFTTSATVSASNVSPGGTITFTARVTSSTTRTVLVDVELYGPTSIRLEQLALDNEAFTAGVERTFPVSWNVPAGAAIGGYTVKVGIYTPAFGQHLHWNDSAGFFTVGMATPPPPGGPIRIMPLGDSLTDGFNVNGGYRIDLWTMLAAAHHSVDFVGSRHNGVPGLADKDHEGHPGWRIDELAGGVTPWLLAYRPQIVLLLIGTNDMVQNFDVAGAPSRLSALIDQIRTAVPDAAIVVSSLPRVSDAATLARIQAYNSQIPGIVASKGSKVSYVNAFAAIEPVHLAADGTHLTHNGYGKLATVWYPTVDAILDVLAPPPPATPTALPVCSSPQRVAVSTAKGMPGQLLATVTALGAGNGLREIRIGDAQNAIVTVAGQSGRGNFTVPLPSEPASVSFAVVRDPPGQRVQVPFVAVDRCGDWNSFVGGGPLAF